jgi:hypothetical protein
MKKKLKGTYRVLLSNTNNATSNSFLQLQIRTKNTHISEEKRIGGTKSDKMNDEERIKDSELNETNEEQGILIWNQVKQMKKKEVLVQNRMN